MNIAKEKVGKAEALGRWPANLIHDGSEEAEGLFPSGADGSAARFFFCPKASKKDKDEGLDFMPEQVTDVHARHYSRRMDEIKRADGKPPSRGRNIHPTVKPTDLMAYLCRLVTPPGGIVLDPFAGSGSTGKAALREGFRFVGFELGLEYWKIAKARARKP